MFLQVFFSGLLYGFIEYSLHRFAHIYNNKRHYNHHIILKYTNDYYRFVKKAVQMFLLFSPLIYSFITFRLLYIQYLLYDFTHVLIHRNISNKNVLFIDFVRYHNVHHYIQQWNKNYGVLTPFWDYVFGTMSGSYRSRTTPLIYLTCMPYFSFVNFLLFTNRSMKLN